MLGSTRRFYPLLVLFLLVLSGWRPSGHAKHEETAESSPSKGFRIEGIQQERTEAISWIKIQVVANTAIDETWAVLQDIQEWAQFLRIFSRVTTMERTENMTRYRFSVSPPWPVRDFDSVIWMAKLPEQRLIFWRSSKDDLTRSHGRIEVKETPAGTRVSYEMHTPLKGAFPKWVVRIGLYLVVPHMAEDFYNRIKQQGG